MDADLNMALNETLAPADVSSIVGMAWQDDISFEAMALQFGLSESDVIALMRAQLKPRSFKVWRMRVRGRAAKHGVLQDSRAQNQQRAQDPAVSDAMQPPEDFPLPPSSITRQSLR